MRNRFSIARRQVLHHDRKHALTQARIHYFLAMLRQVARGAADHYSELVGHGRGSQGKSARVYSESERLSLENA